MMGERTVAQEALFYSFNLDRHVPADHLLRSIDRVESGCPCRMDTKRKILEALGLKPEAREQVFGPDIDQG